MIEAIKKLLALLHLHREEVSAIYFYAIMSSIIHLSLPLGIQAIIGLVMGASMVTSIYILIFIVVLGVLLVGIMQIKQMDNVEKIQQKIFVQYAFEFSEKIPKVNLASIDNYYLPEKVNRFFDVLTLQKGLSKVLLDIPIAAIQLILGFILLSLYHPLFFIISFIFILIVFSVIRFTSKKGFESSMEESNGKYETVSWIEEMARVAKSFKLSQGSHYNLLRTDKNVSNYLNFRTSHYKILKLQYKYLIAVKVLLTLLMLALGSYLMLEQKINIGEFIASEIVILMLIASTEKIITNFESVYDVMTAVEKLESIVGLELEKNGTVMIEAANGIAIQMNNLSYTYSNGSKALNNIDINVPAKNKVIISGNADSGKSTFLKILSGNYLGYTGQYYINDEVATQYDLESLRTNLGKYINQFDLFDGSVWDNIAMNRPGITQEFVRKLAKEIGFDDLFLNLQNGFDTHVDSHGRRLSSSMVKKILLLRALCNQPKLLLLEEPLEGLSIQEKEKLTHYILNELKDATIFIVTNDKEFAKEGDQHIVLESGNIIKYEK